MIRSDKNKMFQYNKRAMTRHSGACNDHIPCNGNAVIRYCGKEMIRYRDQIQ